MIDLNDLRVFEKVASLRSFSAAARALGLPKSSVSRSVTRLETELGTRLLQRTTREVELTESGSVLKGRCVDLLSRVDETIAQVGKFSDSPRGLLRISTGIGFGLNVLSEVLPRFLKRYPDVEVAVELTSRLVDPVAEGVDVAIRLGPMPDSNLVAKRLGAIQRYMCAAPSYLERRGSPATLQEVHEHDIVEMLGADGRPRCWMFSNDAGETVEIEARPRLSVNDSFAIYRLVVNGAGIGCLSAYMCTPELEKGRLVRLFPGWTMPATEVSAVFPSNRDLSPTVRAFVDYMRDVSAPGQSWSDDTSGASRSAKERRDAAATPANGGVRLSGANP
jgi:LysR family transcriptional regulator, regulator for bpeEF and oprC